MYWGTSQPFSNQPGGTLAQTPKQQPNMMCPSHVGQQNVSVGTYSLCVDCFAHFHTIKEVYDLQCKFINPSRMYRLFRVGTTMRWSYYDGIVAIHHINNVMGLTTTSFTNETIHHCD